MSGWVWDHGTGSFVSSYLCYSRLSNAVNSPGGPSVVLQMDDLDKNLYRCLVVNHVPLFQLDEGCSSQGFLLSATQDMEGAPMPIHCIRNWSAFISASNATRLPTLTTQPYWCCLLHWCPHCRMAIACSPKSLKTEEKKGWSVLGRVMLVEKFSL